MSETILVIFSFHLKHRHIQAAQGGAATFTFFGEKCHYPHHLLLKGMSRGLTGRLLEKHYFPELSLKYHHKLLLNPLTPLPGAGINS